MFGPESASQEGPLRRPFGESAVRHPFRLFAASPRSLFDVFEFPFSTPVATLLNEDAGPLEFGAIAEERARWRWTNAIA
jgi:hypothetical protein